MQERRGTEGTWRPTQLQDVVYGAIADLDEACKLGFAQGLSQSTRSGASQSMESLLQQVWLRLAEVVAADAAALIIDDADAEDAVSVSRVDPLSLSLVHE